VKEKRRGREVQREEGRGGVRHRNLTDQIKNIEMNETTNVNIQLIVDLIAYEP